VSLREDDDLATFEDIKCHRDTPDAILVKVEGKEVWIPKSHVHDGRLIISQWIAEQKGLV
jgi:hypothetical protein